MRMSIVPVRKENYHPDPYTHQWLKTAPITNADLQALALVSEELIITGSGRNETNNTFGKDCDAVPKLLIGDWSIKYK